MSATAAVQGWGALSGMVAHPSDPGLAYAVPDDVFGPSRIWTLDVTAYPARIVAETEGHVQRLRRSALRAGAQAGERRLGRPVGDHLRGRRPRGRRRAGQRGRRRRHHQTPLRGLAGPARRLVQRAEKTLVADLVEQFGLRLEKVEGVAAMADRFLVVTDNDGAGETALLTIGR